ncbi:nucleoside phosphorylase [Diplocloster modestus]|nr:nucleoside phosphorylase [Diplocloster modestus]
MPPVFFRQSIQNPYITIEKGSNASVADTDERNTGGSDIRQPTFREYSGKVRDKYDRNRSQALINPADLMKPIEGFPDICITTFSKKIIDKTAALANAEVITNLVSANGLNPIYRIRCAGRDFALYCSRVGAPASVCEMEEVIAMGDDKFVFFGSCGVLNDAVVRNRIIVPNGTVRDEGTSYHYTDPEDELVPDPKMTEILRSSLEELRWPYVAGKIFIQFFFGADSMDEEVWHSNDLTDYGIRSADNYMKLAVSCGLRLSCA